MTFYIRDMNIFIFWCPQGILKPVAPGFQWMTVIKSLRTKTLSCTHWWWILVTKCMNERHSSVQERSIFEPVFFIGALVLEWIPQSPGLLGTWQSVSKREEIKKSQERVLKTWWGSLKEKHNNCLEADVITDLKQKTHEKRLAWAGS